MLGRPALPAALVTAFGTLLLLAGEGYHAGEIRHPARVPGPLLAISIDTVPALGLLYGGYRLTNSDLDVEQRWVVCAWTFAGSAAFLGVVWATIAVRRLEGRVIGEPWFPLLVAAVTGAVAGYVAGYFPARARSAAREAGRSPTGSRSSTASSGTTCRTTSRPSRDTPKP